jgi:hypothetical protein
MPLPSLPPDQRGALTIRRYLVPAVVTLVAVAVLIASSPVDAAPRKVKLGISMTEGNRNPAVADEFKAHTGRYPAVWTVWSAWGNPDSKAFPGGMVRALKSRGITPMIFWEPVGKKIVCSDYSRLRKIAAGKHNAYIKAWARGAKRSKTKILLRPFHEINGGYFPWSTRNCGNTVKHYKNAWKKVHWLVKKKIKAKNVKFVWTVAKSGDPAVYKKHWVGNAYTDFVGYSTFNWGNYNNKSWKSMPQGVKSIMKQFNKFTKKPVIIAETASNSIGGDKAQWIRTGYPAVYKQYPRIKAIVYLNEDLTNVGHPDWSLDTPSPGAMNAYKDIVNDWRFKGKF